MRKLLVASQKSGVGKTTTAINLATVTAKKGNRVLLVDADPVGTVSMSLSLTSHENRKKLRDVGIDMDGEICCEVTPGLDVLSPYDEGIGTEENFEKLLEMLDSEEIRENYKCVILNSPPFMSDRPRHLLRGCDEFILVLRAEPLAFRTLPLFQEMVKTINEEDGADLRGILLTLPEQGRWELDLRRYLGRKVLPQTIPNDPEVPRAESAGQAITQANPNSNAALQFTALSNDLDLGNKAPLKEKKKDKPVYDPEPEVPPTLLPTLSGPRPGIMPPASPSPVSRKTPAPQPAAPSSGYDGIATPAARLRSRRDSGSRRVRMAQRAKEPIIARRSSALAAQEMSRRQKQESKQNPPPSSADQVQAPQATPSGIKRRKKKEKKSGIRPWQVWIASGGLVGIAMGAAKLPEHFLPIGVGLATAVAVVVALRTISVSDNATQKKS